MILLLQNKNNYTIHEVNAYIVYDLDAWSKTQLNNFT